MRESWHDRTISEVEAKLAFLRNLVSVTANRGSARGSDIIVASNASGNRLNIEIQQFDSGAGWRTKTIPSWVARHGAYTFVVFAEPTLERVLNLIPTIPEYSFFAQPNVCLFSDTQISEMVSAIAAIVLTGKL
jgi:hypothetical protein